MLLKSSYSHEICVFLTVNLISSEGGLVFECLAALKVDMKPNFSGTKRLVDLKEEHEENEEGINDHYDGINDEVFSLELERSQNGLGLALVDTRVRSLTMSILCLKQVKSLLLCS